MSNPFRRLPLPALLAVVTAVLAAVVLPAVPTPRRTWSSLEPRETIPPIVMLLGAVPGFLLGLALDGPLTRWREARRARRVLGRWASARRASLDRAEGPVEVFGTLRVVTPVTSRMERRPCAAYASRFERPDGSVERHAAVGDVELRGSGGSAWIEAGPCELAASPAPGEHELRVEGGARVRVRAVASRDAEGRVVLRGDGDLPLVIAPADEDA